MPHQPSIWDSLSSQEYLIDPEAQDIGEVLAQQQLEEEAEDSDPDQYQDAPWSPFD
jgi:hypothetical protein